MSFAYGSRKYGEGFYGGRAGKFKPQAATIIIYALDGTMKGAYQIGVGPFLSLSFNYDDAGCRDFSLEFSTYVNIIQGDKVKIWIFNSDDCFFTGVFRSIPVLGSTRQEFIYSGYGYNDYLQRVNTESQTYLATSIADILTDLLDNRIVPNTPIEKNTSLIVEPGITVEEIVFNYISVADAINQLKEMANSTGLDYITGVDADGWFFFKPRSTETKVTLTVGPRGKYTIQDYAPEKSNEARTKLLILRGDGSYYGSVVSTDGSLDINEEKVNAPDLADADIAVWAAGLLAEKEQVKTQATIPWKIEIQNPIRLTADARVRIISNVMPKLKKTITASPFGAGYFGSGLFGGEQYPGYLIDETLKVVGVEYKISGNEAMRNIQLGNVQASLERNVYEIRKSLEELKTSIGV
jgi:hypothetical protein